LTNAKMSNASVSGQIFSSINLQFLSLGLIRGGFVQMNSHGCRNTWVAA